MNEINQSDLLKQICNLQWKILKIVEQQLISGQHKPQVKHTGKTYNKFACTYKYL